MAVIMFTGIDDMETARRAVEMDIYGYMVKPVEQNQILIGVANALRRRKLELNEKAIHRDLERMVRDRTAELESANNDLRRREKELEAFEHGLEKLVTPFAKRLSSDYLGLTPTEIQVADLIQQVKTTKEIAAALHLSENTIMTHRYKIRTKLGLKKSKQNLRAYLDSLHRQ